MSEDHVSGPILLPYQLWAEEALLEVVLRALEAASPATPPGDHHFYITFRTDHPKSVLPGHLRARYRDEMTVVMQHQYWDLKVDRGARVISVGMSFGNVPSTIAFPFEALVAFVDPHAKFGLRFDETRAARARAAAIKSEPLHVLPDAAVPVEAPVTEAGVVSLDAFRKRRS